MIAHMHEGTHVYRQTQQEKERGYIFYLFVSYTSTPLGFEPMIFPFSHSYGKRKYHVRAHWQRGYLRQDLKII